MRRAFRLAFAVQRFELLVLLGGALVLAVAALLLVWQIRAVRDEQLACFRDADPVVEGSTGSPCSGLDPRLSMLESAAGVAIGAITVTPFVLGLFLGGPVVAREIEHRTAGIAWALSRSRRRWLWRRAAPVLGLVALAGLAVGLGADVLTHAMPWAEGAEVGFIDSAARGPIPMVRGVAVFAIGLAVGAVVGRQLPALLLSAALTVGLFVALSLAMDDLMREGAVPLTSQEQQQGASQKIYGSALRDDATGELISWEDYYRANPDAQDELPPGMTPVVYGVPASRYGEFVLRESAILGAVGLLAIGMSMLAVERRRP